MIPIILSIVLLVLLIVVLILVVKHRNWQKKMQDKSDAHYYPGTKIKVKDPFTGD